MGIFQITVWLINGTIPEILIKLYKKYLLNRDKNIPTEPLPSILADRKPQKSHIKRVCKKLKIIGLNSLDDLS